MKRENKSAEGTSDSKFELFCFREKRISLNASWTRTALRVHSVQMDFKSYKKRKIIIFFFWGGRYFRNRVKTCTLTPVLRSGYPPCAADSLVVLSPTREGRVCDIQLVIIAMVLSTTPIFSNGTDIFALLLVDFVKPSSFYGFQRETKGAETHVAQSILLLRPALRLGWSFFGHLQTDPWLRTSLTHATWITDLKKLAEMDGGTRAAPGMGDWIQRLQVGFGVEVSCRSTPLDGCGSCSSGCAVPHTAASSLHCYYFVHGRRPASCLPALCD